MSEEKEPKDETTVKCPVCGTSERVKVGEPTRTQRPDGGIEHKYRCGCGARWEQ